MLFSKKGKSNGVIKTIAVRSLDRGLGSTHICICLANSLALSGYRVALIEWNGKEEFQEIEKSFNGFGYEKGTEQSFRIRKVDYYKSYQEKGLSLLKKENYDYIIADIGFHRNPYFEEVDVPILLVSGSEWKAARYLPEIEAVEQKIGNRLKLWINFGNKEEIDYFGKKYSGQIVAFPFWKDAFSSSKEQREWIGHLV